jgi:small subunit ribosomal protein S17
MADNPALVRHRNSKVGQVVSRAGDKSIVVEVTRRVQHPFYKRYINKSKKFYAHDEKNQCLVGDNVRIVETRPMSHLKRWRFEKLLHRSAIMIPPELQPEALPLPAPLAVPSPEPEEKAS